MQPTVSVITINYNNVEGLKQTLQSVFEQSYEDYEFIIIDGASNDGAKEIIESHQDRFAYWVSEPDSGIYNAMNKGIKEATGSYLLFLNSGDVFTSPSALSDFVNHKDFHGDIVYGDYKFHKGEKIYPDTLTPVYFMRTSLPHQSTLFKREVFETMGMYDESYQMGGDRAFYIKCFLSGSVQFTHVNYFLTLFDMEGISNSESHRKRKKDEDDRMFREFYGPFYDDCKRLLALEQELKHTQTKTSRGVLRRIGQKIKKLWMHRRW